MKLIDKIRNIKVNFEVVIGILILMIIGIIAYGINYCFYSPSAINKYIASNLYEAPVNDYFVDDNLYQCVVDAYNEGNNTSLPYTTSLSDEQLQSITSVSCNNKGVVFTNGIDKLTELTELVIVENNLTGIDVRKNKKLTKLNVSSNLLQSLDVSQNTLLEELYVDNTNLFILDVANNSSLKVLHASRSQLTSLDVSNNKQLEDLRVGETQLSSLNIGENNVLDTLWVSDNKLTSLDISGVSKLRLFYAYENQFTFLDLSNNHSLAIVDLHSNKLSNINLGENTSIGNLILESNLFTSFSVGATDSLQSLDISDNQLTSLDVSGASILSSLDVRNNKLDTLDVSAVSSLCYLHADSNLLTDLDVSQNSLLEDLEVSDNQLTNLDLSKNTALLYLDISRNEFDNLNVVNNDALISLYANGNKLTGLDVSNNIALEYLQVEQNKLTSFNVNNNAKLKELAVSGNKLTELNLKNNVDLMELFVSNNQLSSLDIGVNLKLTTLYIAGNQLENLDISSNILLETLDVCLNNLDNLNLINNTKLKILYAFDNKLTSLDISKNTLLMDLRLDNNLLTDLDINSNTRLNILYVTNNQLSNLNVSNNILLKELHAGNNKLENLNVNGAVGLEMLYLSSNQLEKLDVSENISLIYLDVTKNKLTNLDLSKNTVLKSLKAFNNLFNRRLVPILKGTSISLDDLEIMVNLPSQLVPVTTIEVSDGLEIKDDNIIAIKSGTQNYMITSVVDHLGGGYTETYTIEVVDIESNKYNVDIFKDYIIVGADSNDVILDNINVLNGDAFIEKDELLIKNGDYEVKRFNLLRLSSSVYDLNNDYIYVGNSTDDEIINNIETDAIISINDNVLSIVYDEECIVCYTLIRLSTSYDISEGYIYTWDSNIIDNIEIINGSKNIVNNNLVISYDNVELTTIPILNISSDSYVVAEDYVNGILMGKYIYTGLSNIDLNNINRHEDLLLSISNNKVILTYKNSIIDEVPYYHLKSNSNSVRFDSAENKIYINDAMMTYEELLNVISFNSGDKLIELYDQSNSRITNDSLFIEVGSYIKVYYSKDTNYLIEIDVNSVKYTNGADVYITSKYGVDILKNLGANNTFINVRDLIVTDGDLSILDKDDNVLDETSNIKTGDKFVVTFPSNSQYFIHLSVKGDVTGKGNISNEDVLKSYSILRGNTVEDYYRFASDINEDGKVKINDVAKLYQYVNNKIESLED